MSESEDDDLGLFQVHIAVDALKAIFYYTLNLSTNAHVAWFNTIKYMYITFGALVICEQIQSLFRSR